MNDNIMHKEKRCRRLIISFQDQNQAFFNDTKIAKGFLVVFAATSSPNRRRMANVNLSSMKMLYKHADKTNECCTMPCFRRVLLNMKFIHSGDSVWIGCVNISWLGFGSEQNDGILVGVYRTIKNGPMETLQLFINFVNSYS